MYNNIIMLKYNKMITLQIHKNQIQKQTATTTKGKKINLGENDIPIQNF